MQRYFVLVAAGLVVSAIVGLTAGVGQSRAQGAALSATPGSTVGVGLPNVLRPLTGGNGPCELSDTDVGYEEYTIPNTGSSASAQITDPAKQPIDFLGWDEGYVEVSNNDGSHFLKAGIYQDGSKFINFIQYANDTQGSSGIIQEQYASYGSPYLAKITKVADGNWTAQIGAHSITHVDENGMTKTEFFGEALNNNTDGGCDGLGFQFANSSPWATPMNAKFPGSSDPLSGIYGDTNVSSHGWDSVGGCGVSGYPLCG